MKWFRERRYKHVDRPVGKAFAEKVTQPDFVKRHPFSPLIHYTKDKIKYKPKDHKTVVKDRHINVPSHRDACIYSYYCSLINERLEAFYKAEGLDDKAIAYRKLGRGNYAFSAEALDFAMQNAPCTIICVDVESFFDTLDHKQLKYRLASLLGVEKLSADWYAVFRSVTRFHYLELDDIKAFPEYEERLRPGGAHPIATVADLKAKGIKFHPNPRPGQGIPQGTPISATLANLYMVDFDKELRDYTDDIGAMYRRYSDDVLIVCRPEKANAVISLLTSAIERNKLEISDDKTEITEFDPSKPLEKSRRCAQYLGFAFYPGGAGIRPGSMARHWRKMKQAVRHLERRARYTSPDVPIYTKKIRRRFQPVNARNFSKYARLSAKAFGKDSKIKHQIKRAEKWMHDKLSDIEAARAVSPTEIADNGKSLD